MKFTQLTVLVGLLIFPSQVTSNSIHEKEEGIVLIPSSTVPFPTSFKAALLAGNDKAIRFYATPDSVNQLIADDAYPLNLAIASNCKASTIRHLIELGADVNKKMPESKYAIVTAIKENRKDVVALLLQHGALVTYDCECDVSLLNEAAKQGNVSISKLLLEYGADPKQESGDAYHKTTPLETASFHNKAQVAKLLLKYDVLAEKNNDTAGSVLTEEEMLIFTPSRRDNMALPYAVKNNNLRLSHLLLEKGADVQGRFRDAESLEYSLLYLAAQANNYKLNKLLLKSGAKIDHSSFEGLEDGTPLYKAIENGNIKLYKLLRESGATLTDTVTGFGNYRKFVGRTKSSKMLDYLEVEGVELKGTDNMGKVLLNHIADAGNEALFAYAIQKGYTIDAAALAPFLHAAVRNNSKEMCLYALEKGANVNQLSEYENKPLIYYARSNEIRQMLINYGADATIESPSLSNRKGER